MAPEFKYHAAQMPGKETRALITVETPRLADDT